MLQNGLIFSYIHIVIHQMSLLFFNKHNKNHNILSYINKIKVKYGYL